MRLIICNFLVGLLVTTGACGQLPASRDVLIEPGETLEACSLQVATDGHILLAGAQWATRSAWAVNMDPNGHVQWRINVPSEDPEKESTIESEFNSMAVLSGGTVALCGHIGVKRSSTRPGYVQLVKPDGSTFKEARLYPKSDTDLQMGDFSKCIYQNGRLYAIGMAIRFNPIPDGKKIGDYFAWVAAFDAEGNLQWSRTVPSGLQHVDRINSVVFAQNGGIVLAAHGDGHTEIISLDREGQASARLSLVGRYQLVQTALAQRFIQAFTAPLGRHWEVLTIDETLSVIGRAATKTNPDIGARAVWSSEDGHLWVFGESIRDGALEEAIILKMEFRQQDVVILDAKSLFNSYTIDAVWDDAGKHQFVVSRRLNRPWDRNHNIDTTITFIQHN
jgi:hypothetical protein